MWGSGVLAEEDHPCFGTERKCDIFEEQFKKAMACLVNGHPCEVIPTM